MVGAHAVTNKGLGAPLMPGADAGDPTFGDTCHTMIVNAGSELLTRAHHAHAVRSDVTITQLLKLVGAIAPATELDSDGAAETEAPPDARHRRGVPTGDRAGAIIRHAEGGLVAHFHRQETPGSRDGRSLGGALPGEPQDLGVEVGEG
ncbi:SbtR family transcriptional regulator, partial [Streptomyces sp. NPDC002690]